MKDKHATGAQAGRYAKGTMHPKLMLLEYPGFLRVSIASANMSNYDRNINNQFWVHDFPLKTPAAQRAANRAVQNADAAGVEKKPPGEDFGDDLMDFVDRITSVPTSVMPDAPMDYSARDPWREVLARYEFDACPPGVTLIASVPG